MRSTILALASIAVLTGVGCARQSSSDSVSTSTNPRVSYSSNPGTGTGTGTTPTPTPTPVTGSNVVKLTTNTSAMSSFVGTTISTLSDVTLTINLSNFGQANYSGRFQGTISLNYSVNGRPAVTPTFQTGSASGDIQYNYWWQTSSGQNRFQAFAEEPPFYTFYNWPCDTNLYGMNCSLYPVDPLGGGLIIVIDTVQDFGDGGNAIMGGKVYFRNFRQASYPKPDMKCWLIPNNPPYDCKGFLSGTNINPNIGGDPGNGYQMLGTFTGLNASQALGFK